MRAPVSPRYDWITGVTSAISASSGLSARADTHHIADDHQAEQVGRDQARRARLGAAQQRRQRLDEFVFEQRFQNRTGLRVRGRTHQRQHRVEAGGGVNFLLKDDPGDFLASSRPPLDM